MAIKNRAPQNDPRDYGEAGLPSEKSAFKKGLSGISLETIRAKLDGTTITRKWKRDLVEAELARREVDSDDDDVAEATDGVYTGRPWIRQVVRFVAGGIIGGCVVILLYAAYEVWTM